MFIMFHLRFAAFNLWRLAGFEKIHRLNLHPVNLCSVALPGAPGAAYDHGCAFGHDL
jgi:hypothetical protein